MKYNNNGYTPLHAACINGNIDIVNSLLKCNSSVNLFDINILLYILLVQMVIQMLYRFYLTIIVTFSYKSKFDQHAIHIACEEGYKDNVEILIKHNVDINLCGGLREHTPIQYACLKGHTDIVKLLLDKTVKSLIIMVYHLHFILPVKEVL